MERLRRQSQQARLLVNGWLVLALTGIAVVAILALSSGGSEISDATPCSSFVQEVSRDPTVADGYLASKFQGASTEELEVWSERLRLNCSKQYLGDTVGPVLEATQNEVNVLEFPGKKRNGTPA